MTLKLAYISKRKENEVEVEVKNYYNIEKQMDKAFNDSKEWYLENGVTWENFQKMFKERVNKLLLQNSLKKK